VTADEDRQDGARLLVRPRRQERLGQASFDAGVGLDRRVLEIGSTPICALFPKAFCVHPLDSLPGKGSSIVLPPSPLSTSALDRAGGSQPISSPSRPPPLSRDFKKVSYLFKKD
jgi:hypothetical protein